MDWQSVLAREIYRAINTTIKSADSRADCPDYRTVLRAIEDAKADAPDAYLDAVQYVEDAK